jgi:hypothetical protein
MTMRRHVVVALTVLSLAGCASTPTSPLKSGGDAIDPAGLRPDLSDDVIGGIQTRELNSVIRGH